MENQTCYDLNAAMENWRQELVAQPNLTPDVRRELETHLRDAIAGFQRCGLNDEDAFWLARRRIGPSQQLAEEFVKADPGKVWRERVFYIALALIVVTLWREICEMLFAVVSSLFQNTGLRLSIHRLPQAMIRTVVQLLTVLPVLWFGALCVWGRAPQNSMKGPQLVLQSRPRLVVVAIALTLLIAASSTLLYMGLPGPNKIQTTDWLFCVANDLSGGIILPAACIALLAWLFPTRNRKTPQRA